MKESEARALLTHVFNTHSATICSNRKDGGQCVQDAFEMAIQSLDEREKLRNISGNAENVGVLMVEMPKSCSKCKFMYEFYGVKKCQLLNILQNGGVAIIPTETLTTARKDCCPLVPMTESEAVSNGI